MNPYLQAMLRRVHAQQLTPGGDQVTRPGVLGGTPSQFWGAASDPRIFGAGRQTSAGWLGQPGSPAMPPQVMQDAGQRQLGAAQNVLRDLARGADPVLTGSGFEVPPQQLMSGGPNSFDVLARSGPNVLDVLQQSLQPQPQMPPGQMMGLMGLGGGWQ